MLGNAASSVLARMTRRGAIVALLCVSLAFLGFAAVAFPPFAHAQYEPVNLSAPSAMSSESFFEAAESLRTRARAESPTEDFVRLEAEIATLLEELALDRGEATPPEWIVHLHHSREIARKRSGNRDEKTPQTAHTDDAQLDEKFRAGLARAARHAQRSSDYALAAHALIEEALLAERSGDEAEALAAARAAATQAAKVALRRPLYRTQWLIARIHQRAGDEAAALRAYRSAVHVLEEMKADLVAGTEQDAFSFREEVAPVYLGLADLLLRRADKLGRGADEREADAGLTESWAEIREAAQNTLREARRTIEASRQAELRDHFEDACLTQLESESPDSIPGTVVVYPVVLPDRLVLIVGREGKLSQHRAPISIEEYAKLTESFRMHLENRMTRRYRKPAAALYNALIQPISRRLKEAPVETIVFIPDRALRQIPLGALYHREAKRFLIEEYALAIVPSLELTSPRRLPEKGAQLLAGALTQSVQGFPALEFVADEVEAASRAFPAEVLMDEALRVSPLVDALRERPFEVLHIASHAEFRSEAKESFLLTWDGKLSLDQLSNAIGNARFRTERPLELLVLSACETAGGDDRAALGLAGAALQMGARSVLASLWSVNDEASSVLMKRYYAALSEPQSTRAEALRKAQRSLIAEKAYAHPSAWAPFILIGSWL